jgi:hypothetical protein
MTTPDYTYSPDSWCIVKITGTHPHYRVFGSWSGGYLDGDSWRLNSGITSVTEDDEFYYFYGSTGSVYRCYKEGYGIRSMHNRGVLEDYCEKSHNTMEAIYEKPEIMNMEWLIK